MPRKGNARQNKLKNLITDSFLFEVNSLINASFPPAQRNQIVQLINYPGPLQSDVCGRVFQAGDVVYRCEVCGYDGTCVLCSDCFKEEEHDGHEVRFFTSQGSGGCCDCGDAESWNLEVPVPCKHPRSKPTRSNDPESIIRKYPKVTGEKPERRPQISLTNQDIFEAVAEHPEEPGPCWRNEIDSQFSSDIFDFSSEFIANATKFLHGLFSKIILAYQTKRMTFEEGDNVQLIYNDETHSFDEVIASVKKALKCSRENASNIARYVDKHGRCPICVGYFESFYPIQDELWKIELRTRMPELKIYLEEEVSFLMMKMLIDFSKISSFRKIINEHIFAEINREFYVEEMMTYDHFLYKEYRSLSKEFFITCIMSSPLDYKIKFAEYFGKHYSYFYDTVYLMDVEPEHSIVLFSVQLFTSPGIAKMLIFKGKILQDMLKLLNKTFENAIDTKTGIVKADDKSLKVKRFFQLFHDFSTLISHSEVQGEFQCIWECRNDPQKKESFDKWKGYFEKLIEFISIFEGIDQNIRQMDVHVEYENTSWIQAFNLSLQVASIIEPLSKCLGEFFLPSIESHVKIHTGSFHTPLSWLAGNIIEYHCDAIREAKYSIDQFPNLFNSCWDKQLFVAAVQSNLWVRNGYSIKNQLLNYLSPRTFGEMYANDCKLLSFFASLMKKSKPTTNIFPLKFESARHLEEFIVLIIRFISFSQISDILDPKPILIHNLAQGPQSIDELQEGLPESCSEGHFECLLEEVSVKVGKKFELKPEYYSSVDPCHPILFSVEERTKVISYLKSKNYSAWNNVFGANSDFDLEPLKAVILQCPNEYVQSNELLLKNLFARLNDLPFFRLKLESPLKETPPTTSIDKKQQAKEYRDKIRKEMLQAQQQFTEKNDQTESSIQTDCCIICQSSLKSRSFGYWGNREYFNFNKFYNEPLFPYFIYSTCGHPVHRECFATYKDEIESNTPALSPVSFMLTCPFCQRIGNTYIPATQPPPYPNTTNLSWSKEYGVGYEIHYDLSSSSNKDNSESDEFDEFEELNELEEGEFNPYTFEPLPFGINSFEYAESYSEYQFFQLLLGTLEAFFCQQELIQRCDTTNPYYEFSSELFDKKIFNYLFRLLYNHVTCGEMDWQEMVESVELSPFQSLCRTLAYRYEIPTQDVFKFQIMHEFEKLTGSSWLEMKNDFLNEGNPEKCYFLVLTEFFKCFLYPSYKSTLKFPKSFMINNFNPARLFELPNRIDQLMTKLSTELKCQSCKTPSKRSELGICLICGVGLCPRQSCCSSNLFGECYQHLKQCGFDTGLFFIAKKGSILVLNSSGQGCLIAAPYTDKKGELKTQASISNAIKRGSLLFLDTEAYQELNLRRMKGQLINCITNQTLYSEWFTY